MKKIPVPYLTRYGRQVIPWIHPDGTWIEGEEMCSYIGQFRRRAYVTHCKTNENVLCVAGIPDTYFSIPATTETEHGYITGKDNGNGLEFRPHTDQTQSPADYRKQYKKNCR
jgi:hypothetical protein